MLLVSWQTRPMSEPTLLVADDHPLFRAAVLHVLRERLPQYRTLEAASAATLGQALQEHPEVELVLLDLSMPGTRGFSALLHVRGEYPELPVVIISSNDHPRVIRRAQQFGAAGFIPKSAPAEAMGEAIAAVLDAKSLADMAASGAGQTKLTRRGNYNQEPCWSPRPINGKSVIAFSGRDERGNFDIFTVGSSKPMTRAPATGVEMSGTTNTSPNMWLKRIATSRASSMCWQASMGTSATKAPSRSTRMQRRPWSRVHV